MEVLLGYLGYELLGTVMLTVMIYLGTHKKKEKQKKLSRAEQIALDTARLEAENRRLELERDRDLDAKFSVLKTPVVGPETLAAIEAKGEQFAADVRATRIKAEFAYYQSKGELPENSLLDECDLDRLTSYYESQISKAFNTVPMILTDGTRIEFRKLS